MASAKTYTVEQGETLWGIAEKLLGNGARFQEIVALNPNLLSNPNIIRTGWQLTLPEDANVSAPEAEPAAAEPEAAARPEAAAPEDIVHPVESGDTLSSIAAKYNIDDWRTIRDANPELIRGEDGIFVGTELRIPQPRETSAPEPSPLERTVETAERMDAVAASLEETEAEDRARAAERNGEQPNTPNPAAGEDGRVRIEATAPRVVGPALGIAGKPLGADLPPLDGVAPTTRAGAPVPPPKPEIAPPTPEIATTQTEEPPQTSPELRALAQRIALYEAEKADLTATERRDHVRAIQQGLNEAGFKGKNSRALEVDGLEGQNTNTRYAMTQFQESHRGLIASITDTIAIEHAQAAAGAALQERWAEDHLQQLDPATLSNPERMRTTETALATAGITTGATNGTLDSSEIAALGGYLRAHNAAATRTSADRQAIRLFAKETLSPNEIGDMQVAMAMRGIAFGTAGEWDAQTAKGAQLYAHLLADAQPLGMTSVRERSDEAKALQTALTRAGYPTTADGLAGEGTARQLNAMVADNQTFGLPEVRYEGGQIHGLTSHHMAALDYLERPEPSKERLFVFPVHGNNVRISGIMGDPRRGWIHEGTDFSPREVIPTYGYNADGSLGTYEIYQGNIRMAAAADGLITGMRSSDGMIQIQYDNGCEDRHYHSRSFRDGLRVGSRVEAGQWIARQGSKDSHGRNLSVHGHVERRCDGKLVPVTFEYEGETVNANQKGQRFDYTESLRSFRAAQAAAEEPEPVLDWQQARAPVAEKAEATAAAEAEPHSVTPGELEAPVTPEQVAANAMQAARN